MSHQGDFQVAVVLDILNKMSLIGNVVSTHVVINILSQCSYMIYSIILNGCVTKRESI